MNKRLIVALHKIIGKSFEQDYDHFGFLVRRSESLIQDTAFMYRMMLSALDVLDKTDSESYQKIKIMSDELNKIERTTLSLYREVDNELKMKNLSLEKHTEDRWSWNPKYKHGNVG